MATLTIRQLDDHTYAQLKARAASNHRSLEDEARDRLTRSVAAVSSDTDWADAFRRVAIDAGPEYEGSVALIRAIRDEE